MGQSMRAGRTVSSIPVGYDRNGRPIRVWKRRKDLSLREAFAYPLVDGPGIALLFFFPPLFAIMAVPVFDLMGFIKPGNVLNPIVLMILPFTIPLICSFALTFGYILLFFGRILSSSALGETDHPRFPKWDRSEILEELARWTWAGLMGLAIGGLPAMIYWMNCGAVDVIDVFLFADLAILGASYAQLALVASLMHETLLAANPVTVFRSIARIGWDYLGPCVVTGLTVMVLAVAWTYVLLRSPNIQLGVLGLWACWILTFYSGMVIFRVLGTVYYKHEGRLRWFQTTRG